MQTGTKASEIVERIGEAIVEGRLPPGSKLNERDLAEAFDVSRTIVRQALDRLHQDGLIAISPKRATTVAKPTIEEAHELFEAIGLIESAVLERIAQTASKADIQSLKRHVASERRAAAAGDTALANRLGRDFHERFVGLARNGALARAHAQLMRQEALISALFKTDFDYTRLQQDHADVVEHLAGGDVAEAKQVLAAHYKLVILGHHIKDGVPPEIDIRRLFAS